MEESVIRVVVTAGREAVRPLEGEGGSAASLAPDAHACRTVAIALVGGGGDVLGLDESLDAFATDPNGVRRFEAMAQRARQALVRQGAGPGEVVPVARMLSVTSVHAAFLRAVQRRRDASEHAYEHFANAVASIVDASDYDEVCARAATAMCDLSGMPEAALYVPGHEAARYRRVAHHSGGPQSMAPPLVRIDRGLFADVIAGERPVFITGREPLDAIPGADASPRTLVAVPLRDAINRPVGLALAVSHASCELDVDAVEALRRLGSVVEGAISAADAARRNHAALNTLPDLASVARRDQRDVADQLEELARIVVSATESDCAVVRVRDPAGRYLETRAVYSRHSDAVSDIIGSRSLLDGAVPEIEAGVGEHEVVDGIEPEEWSPSGQRMLTLLGARSIASFPIGSLYGRPGVLYVLRRTARSFTDADLACARIVTSHAQHVIDRAVSELQTSRAIDAARSAIRLLGEALVGGVRTERTLRFVPRLYHEMFDTVGCRMWRVDDSGEPTLVSGAGQMERPDPSRAVRDALASGPLSMVLATEQRPHVGAVAIEEYQGTRLVIEFQLSGERSLGHEEQQLAADVAHRIAEALYSAGQAAAQQRQLDRVRALQHVIALAHEELTERHVVNTLLEEVPKEFGAAAEAVFVIESGGRLEARAARGVPEQVLRTIEAARHWAPDAVGDDRSAVLTIADVGTDPRTVSLHQVLHDTAFAGHGALVVPLVAREQTVGALMMFFAGEVPEHTGGEADMLPTLGQHVGSALINARDLERERLARLRVERVLEIERENSRQVRALHEVSRTFATSLSFRETLRAVVEAMANRLDVDAVWIRTANDRGDAMDLRAFYASHPELAGALERMMSPPEPIDDPVTQQVLQTRQPVLASGDAGERAAAEALAGSEVLRRLDPFLQRGSTIAVLPVATPHEVLGTVTMLSIDPDNALTYEKVDIATGVASQAALALDNARLYQQQKSFAEVIQDSLLPGRLPEIPGLDLGVLYRSATSGGDSPTIGGDFYDFLELDDGRLALAVGDVTGKGVGAAADTAMTKYIFRALAREHPSPASFLRYANEVVCEEITPGKFVTLFYAVIDPVRNRITCGNAGHPEPKIVTAPSDGSEPAITSLGMEGLALGIMPDQDYEQREYPFEPGSAVVVYTDGVVEARRGGKLYGQYRLERRIADEAAEHAAAPRIVYAVYEDCARYAEGGLSDDVAIVVAKRVADEEEPSPPTLLRPADAT